MQPLAFSRPGRFFRGNLHTHSTRSDGALPPDEVCRRYHAQGYDFICMSDHLVGLYDYPITETQPLPAEGFATLLGAEVHSGAMQNGEIWHLLAVGLPADFAPPEAPDFTARAGQETGPALARRCREAGAFVSIAHPEWSGMTLDDARSIEAAHSVEIYNHGCRVDSDRGYGLHVLDLLLSEGRRLDLIATDDAHFQTSDAFGGWVMVKAAENSPEALLEALKDGAYYASQGPEIHDLRLDGDRLSLRCSPASSVVLLGHGSGTVAIHGEGLTEVEIPFGRCAASPWLRLSVIDAQDRRAWSNPIWRA